MESILSTAGRVGVALAILIGSGPPVMASTNQELPIIPAVRSWAPDGGQLDPASLQGILVDHPDHLSAARDIADFLASPLGRTLSVSSDESDRPAIVLTLDVDLQPGMVEIVVDETGIRLGATDPGDWITGAAVIYQMLLVSSDGILPTGRITDGPGRFGWRSMMLDCGRHFMPVAVIKDLIDQLAVHKFNFFHWHLTEDQGWRLEVPALPRLTEVGAWRTESDGTTAGGFYDAADVREVVAHARSRGITVIPEIEMPGHSTAALAAYPELSCTGGPFAVETLWGIHPDCFCAGNDEVFAFLEIVLDRVVELFPGPYVHIGGDEVMKDRWSACPRCQARIRAEGLKDENELQSWFLARIESYLGSRSRRMIGWDEILDGDFLDASPSVIVQSWRGFEGATEAAARGHDAVVTPTSDAYFDYDPVQLPLHRVLRFDPAEAAPGSPRILGGGLNLWTEYVPPERVATMLYPRISAMAEVLWNGPGDLVPFLHRMDRQRPVLDHLGVRPGPAARPVSVNGRWIAADTAWKIRADIEENLLRIVSRDRLELRYRFDSSGGNPDFRPDLRVEDQGWSAISADAPVWPLEQDLEVEAAPQGARVLTVQLFVDGLPYGSPAVQECEYQAAIGSRAELRHVPSQRFGDGDPGLLTDGLFGSRRFDDGRWLGFEGNDLDAVLEVPPGTTTLRARFLQDANSWIFLPEYVECSTSRDGKQWDDPVVATHEISDRRQEKVIHEFVFDLPAGEHRWMMVRAVNRDGCPDWHPGAGDPAWIFCDEVICR